MLYSVCFVSVACLWIGTYAWISLSKGSKSVYYRKSFYDDTANDSIKSVIEELKNKKSINAEKLLVILKKKFNVNHYKIIILNPKRYKYSTARTHYRNKFEISKNFQEDMSIKVFMDCIHEIQHAIDKKLLLFHWILTIFTLIFIFGGFYLKSYVAVLLGVICLFLSFVIQIKTERDAVDFSGNESRQILLDLGFDVERSIEASKYIKDKANYTKTWYTWEIVQRYLIITPLFLIVGWITGRKLIPQILQLISISHIK